MINKIKYDRIYLIHSSNNNEKYKITRNHPKTYSRPISNPQERLVYKRKDKSLKKALEIGEELLDILL